MDKTIVFSEYDSADAEEALEVLKAERPGHTFSMQEVTVTMFGEDLLLVGILDETAEEIALLCP